MGIGYTLDTPLKISQYGIDSVISLADDILIEKIRKFYCEKFGLNYEEISDKIEDFRAKRICSYLNLIQDLSDQKFEELENVSNGDFKEIHKYISLLPSDSKIKKEYNELEKKNLSLQEIQKWIKTHLHKGSIDVNVMTKLDKENYKNKEKLPMEYNDAFAALRGFATSKLSSAVVFSAGMSPRLYAYLENFKDFYPDKNGNIKKKVILKVSDYRSALIQGKFLAKKGIWISEYRIESGLNCGGHAFATEGFLMGPILAEFRDNKAKFEAELMDIYENALRNMDKSLPTTEPKVKISAQGGVGTNEEHNFLLNHFKIDSVGWGSPFLLVPEVCTVDENTLHQLEDAKEEDLTLSSISPLGVLINNLEGNTKDDEKAALINKGRAGSSCPKKFLALNKEFEGEALCTASRKYQYLKLKQLDEKELEKEDYNKQYKKIVEKSCICVGLGTSALIVNDIDTKTEGTGVSICPGPNMAYYSKLTSLKEMSVCLSIILPKEYEFS